MDLRPFIEGLAGGLAEQIDKSYNAGLQILASPNYDKETKKKLISNLPLPGFLGKNKLLESASKLPNPYDPTEDLKSYVYALTGVAPGEDGTLQPIADPQKLNTMKTASIAQLAAHGIEPDVLKLISAMSLDAYGQAGQLSGKLPEESAESYKRQTGVGVVPFDKNQGIKNSNGSGVSDKRLKNYYTKARFAENTIKQWEDLKSINRDAIDLFLNNKFEKLQNMETRLYRNFKIYATKALPTYATVLDIEDSADKLGIDPNLRVPFRYRLDPIAEQEKNFIAGAATYFREYLDPSEFDRIKNNPVQFRKEIEKLLKYNRVGSGGPAVTVQQIIDAGSRSNLSKLATKELINLGAKVFENSNIVDQWLKKLAESNK